MYLSNIDLKLGQYIVVAPHDSPAHQTMQRLPINSAGEPEALEPGAQEQTEASVILTVGIVLESGEQVLLTFYIKTFSYYD